MAATALAHPARPVAPGSAARSAGRPAAPAVALPSPVAVPYTVAVMTGGNGAGSGPWCCCGSRPRSPSWCGGSGRSTWSRWPGWPSTAPCCCGSCSPRLRWYLFFVARMRRPNPACPLPAGRVAMVVTKAPSEPWPVVRRTLEGMLRQDFPRPYDVWLADEDPDEETRPVVRRARGARVLPQGRRRVPQPHLAPPGPVQGGQPGLLLRPLRVRGLRLRGPARRRPRPGAGLPAGDGAALRRPGGGLRRRPQRLRRQRRRVLGGAGPPARRGGLARAAAGGLRRGLRAGCASAATTPCARAPCARWGAWGRSWPRTTRPRCCSAPPAGGGRFALDAIAHGDGPATLADFLTQELQWSRSLVNVLLTVTPRSGARLTAAPEGAVRLLPAVVRRPRASMLVGYGLRCWRWPPARRGRGSTCWSSTSTPGSCSWPP